LLLTREREKSEITQRKKELLGTIVQQITFAIENEMLFEQALEKRRIDKELSLAKEIQNKLLPISNPSKEHFEIASFIHPCETVSGDYFDFFAISPTVIGIAIGDICGKGVPAALLTSTVQAAIHSQLEYTESPEQIIRNLNRLLIRNTAESIFLTLFFGLIDLESNQFKYVNAGHPPPIFIQKKSRIKELGGTAPALGVFEGNFDSERSIKFEPGDILVMYTDGLIEGQNPERKIYGRRRLLKQVDVLFSERNTQLDTLNAVVDSITDDIIHFIGGAKQQDDLTLLAVRRR
ncbi:serine/threonine-protein phosphatase, partial [candidate division KSB1 bacterium]|nr:serine/threonine-protein phosphatase [candidate division KSB1 bacterium]NIR71584.1 serine/threonine-protein phosphatase [candidate division KSB1 bacterium]NIS27966.1 serine/threonine-protein phosphatase [candidate division KSB1 bacterium]NIT74848.1 serine/threonine-protein phosphatase [candidate division KSB1 bacterium]NIU28623.1 serine/threonine-protein phosphatase [candidate division KSB1 bacterium]